MLALRDALAVPLTPLTQRIRRSGLPRRTYQSALHRVYARQWICDRFVPRPSVTGRRFVLFLIARVSEDHRASVLRQLRRSSGLALCWSLPQTVFGVCFVSEATAGDALLIRLQQAGAQSIAHAMTVDAVASGVAVYFDFEGEWNRYGGIEGLEGYPHGLRDRGVGNDVDLAPAPPSGRVLRTTAEMVLRPFPRPNGVGAGAEPRSRWSLRFAERHMLRAGWVEARSFLNPMAAARALADFAHGVTFVHGELRPACRPAEVLAELVERARVHPFLFASDDRSALLGFLSVGPRTRLAPAPERSESVRSVLERHILQVEVIQADLGPSQTVVPHRYDSLLRSPARSAR